jgi:hypothetical protein
MGLYLRAPYLGQKPVKFAIIRELCIASCQHPSVATNWGIEDIRIEHRGEGDTSHWRLCWTFLKTKEGERAEGIPYSDITGPFSHFCVSVDGMMVGRAYALEFVLHESLVRMLESEGKEVEIQGVGFDGQMLAKECVRLEL